MAILILLLSPHTSLHNLSRYPADNKRTNGKITPLVFPPVTMRRCKKTRTKTRTGRESQWSLSRTEVDANGRKQLKSAATGSGRVDTDVTTLIEGVEPSSFGAAGDRLSFRLYRSCSTACRGDTQTATKSSNVPVGRARTSEERHNFLGKLEFEA